MMPLAETGAGMRSITPALEAAGWDIHAKIRGEVTLATPEPVPD